MTMYKTKIDWADSTWNPVTGCLHGCEYCYASRIANRYGMHGGSDYLANGLLDLAEPVEANDRKQPYPCDFEPTFHRYRLGDPAVWSEPRTIFVGSMTDLFGAWVPQEWQQEVLQACLNAPQHRYLFLTKAPNRVCQWPRYRGDKDYLDFDHDRKNNGAIRENIWMGVSFTGLKEDIPNIAEYRGEPSDDRAWYLGRLPVHFCGHKFMSVEPIHCDVTELCMEYNDGYKEYWFQKRARDYEWIIVGAETGNRKGKIIPERTWIEHLVSFCAKAGIPLFMKESLRAIMGADFRQEFPWKGASE